MDYDLSFNIASRKKFEYIEFKNPKTKNGEITFTAIVDSDKVIFAEFGGKASYSFAVLADKTFGDLMANLCAKVQEKVPDWTVINPAVFDPFYVKLAFDNKNKIFKTNSNIFFDPAVEESLTIPKGKNVEVKAKLMAWFQMSEQKAGVSLNVLRTKFDD